MTDNTKTPNKIVVSLSAIDNYIQENIMKPKERELQGKPFIEYGSSNLYPNYLFDLYLNVAVLQSIINGTADYICGDEIYPKLPQLMGRLNASGTTLPQFVRSIALDLLIYGGTAINVINNRKGNIAEIYPLDFRNIRSDLKNEKFYYSKDWAKSIGRVKFLEYPRYNANDGDINNSIFYYKSNGVHQTYPISRFAASTQSAEILRQISSFHLNGLRNGLTSNVMVSMNNGIPDDETKEEIEELFNQKFTSTENALTPMIVYSNDKHHSVEVTKLDLENYADRYNSMLNYAKQDIYTSFKASPMLFGQTDDNKGFALQQFGEAFKLYNKTTVQPIQKEIVDIFNSLYYTADSFEIKPFSIDWEDNNKATIID